MKLRSVVPSLLAWLALAACSSPGNSAPSTSMTPPAPSSSTTSTTVVPSTTTTTFPVRYTTTSTTSVPETEVPRAKNAVDACAYPEGSHYCIWGTEPLDLVVNNSRIADVDRYAVQTFTAVSNTVSMVEIPLQSADIGTLVLSTPGSPVEPCISVMLTNDAGKMLASATYGDSGGGGRLQRIEVPLEASVRVGGLYAVRISKVQSCAARPLSVRVAMSSLWKYPKASGRLSIDSRDSIGSLWARIN